MKKAIHKKSLNNLRLWLRKLRCFLLTLELEILERLSVPALRQIPLVQFENFQVERQEEEEVDKWRVGQTGRHSRMCWSSVYDGQDGHSGSR